LLLISALIPPLLPFLDLAFLSLHALQAMFVCFQLLLVLIYGLCHSWKFQRLEVLSHADCPSLLAKTAGHVYVFPAAADAHRQ
jgi:hypothetical protein